MHYVITLEIHPLFNLLLLQNHCPLKYSDHQLMCILSNIIYLSITYFNIHIYIFPATELKKLNCMLCIMFRAFTYDSWTLQLTSQNSNRRVISVFHRDTKNILPKQISSSPSKFK